jgi:MFS family permease
VTTQHGSFLATRRGRLTLLLLCAVQFLDVADSSIMNVALPSIRRDLGFSVQSLQWVLSGYLPAPSWPPAACCCWSTRW